MKEITVSHSKPKNAVLLRISENVVLFSIRERSEGGSIMIYREKYLAEIRGFYHSDLIKIITGVHADGIIPGRTAFSALISRFWLISLWIYTLRTIIPMSR